MCFINKLDLNYFYVKITPDISMMEIRDLVLLFSFEMSFFNGKVTER